MNVDSLINKYASEEISKTELQEETGLSFHDIWSDCIRLISSYHELILTLDTTASSEQSTMNSLE